MYRTIEQVYALILKNDPETCLTKYFIRQLARSGEVKTLTAGKKILISYNSVLAYLAA